MWSRSRHTVHRALQSLRTQSPRLSSSLATPLSGCQATIFHRHFSSSRVLVGDTDKFDNITGGSGSHSVSSSAPSSGSSDWGRGNKSTTLRGTPVPPSPTKETSQDMSASGSSFDARREKAGSPSPWAVFDSWGSSQDEDLTLSLSSSQEAMLSSESVLIPVTADERANVPTEHDILEAYDCYLQQKSAVHFGYPYNLQYDHSELFGFMKYSINNLGDPFQASNYSVHSRPFEKSVVQFFARLWQLEDYWGYVTTSGTEGNLHGILVARECHPNGILYTSNETHYSIFKAARYYRMECVSIPTLPMGEMDYDLLAEAIARNRHLPVILNVNIGTTVKGAVDNLDRILKILQDLNIPRSQYHIHCDGALFALMMPFIEDAPQVNFAKPIDSMTVSGHKMLGCPMPCGVALTRKSHVQKLESRIDYLNSVDTTIMGSRNGQAALHMWYSLRKKGVLGIERDVIHCMETARYLRDRVTEAGWACRLNDWSTTVVLERPLDEHLVRRWQLACQEDIAHVVVMPNVTKSKIDVFVKELEDCEERLGRIQPWRADSPLTNLLDHGDWSQVHYHAAGHGGRVAG